MLLVWKTALKSWKRFWLRCATKLPSQAPQYSMSMLQIRPGVDFSNELGPPVIRDSWKDDRGEERQAKKKRTEGTFAAASSQSVSPLPPPPSSSSLCPASLPPLDIPFHQDGASCSTRTTHLVFKPRPKGRKRKSDKKASTSSGTTVPMTGITGSGYRSTPSLTQPADSTSECTSEASDSDSEELVETSLAGRNRITLKMNETPHAADNKITFHGRSSTAGLVEATRQFKHLHMQETMQMQVEAAESTSYEGETRVPIERADNARVASTRRPQFWRTPAVSTSRSSYAYLIQCYTVVGTGLRRC